MGWKERLESAGWNRKATADDEAVARQILRGLGCPMRAMWPVAGRLGVAAEPDDPLALVAGRILEAVSGELIRVNKTGGGLVFGLNEIGLSAAALKGPGVAGLARVAAAQPEGGGYLSFSRQEGAWKARAAILLNDGGMECLPAWLMRPETVLKWRDDDIGVSLWLRPARELVADMASCLGWEIPEAEGGSYDE